MDHLETPPTATTSPTPAVDGKPPRLLDQVRAALTRRQTPPAVISSYVSWIEQFVRFHQLRHPRELGAAEVSRFLSSLAISQQQPLARVAQAQQALVFLYEEVLGLTLEPIHGGQVSGTVSPL
jgi:Phage integrase, N-terminal SAM-like domain